MTAAHLMALLLKLEAVLKQLELWQSTPPSAHALQSTVPFCYDTMPLSSWLQFVFLPKMSALLASEAALPPSMAIIPLAELVYADHREAYAPLFAVLSELEQCLNQA